MQTGKARNSQFAVEDSVAEHLTRRCRLNMDTQVQHPCYPLRILVHRPPKPRIFKKICMLEAYPSLVGVGGEGTWQGDATVGKGRSPDRGFESSGIKRKNQNADGGD